jgi:hypothetical protein
LILLSAILKCSLFRNAAQDQTTHSGRSLLLNGLLFYVVLIRGSHYVRLRVIMEFRMKRCGVFFALLENK